MIGRIGVETPLLRQLAEKKVEEAPTQQGAPSLASRFAEQLRETSELVARAEASAESMAAGEVGSVDTILVLSRAELALRHVVSVRNRMLEAYQEVMRLPL